MLLMFPRRVLWEVMCGELFVSMRHVQAYAEFFLLDQWSLWCQIRWSLLSYLLKSCSFLRMIGRVVKRSKLSLEPQKTLTRHQQCMGESRWLPGMGSVMKPASGSLPKDLLLVGCNRKTSKGWRPGGLKCLNHLAPLHAKMHSFGHYPELNHCWGLKPGMMGKLEAPSSSFLFTTTV